MSEIGEMKNAREFSAANEHIHKHTQMDTDYISLSVHLYLVSEICVCVVCIRDMTIVLNFSGIIFQFRI